MQPRNYQAASKLDSIGGRIGGPPALALVRANGGSRLPARRREPAPSPPRGGPLDPLYLFHCGLMWHRTADTSAGWELTQGLRSRDREARAVSAALLAKTENARLLVRDLRRTRSSLHESRTGSGFPYRKNLGEAVAVNTPYGLEIIESCLSCKLRKDKWFCGLSPDVLKSFSAGSHPGTYPGGALLFVEGQLPRGAFVLCSGKVKLSTTSRDGKVLILKVAEAGEVLGLSATISGTCYELTAETAGPCHVNFVDRDALLRLMERTGEMGVHAAQELSKEFQSVYRDIHELVLARSSAGKLARLLLSWTTARERETGVSEVRVRASLTHEEMAQMIGSSRETVTRLLSDLKKKEFIRLEGSTLVIRNRTALEALAA
jgi:CRP/FNR family transcriptional regulator, cyclic AMP receptor protein